jgi:hypothetical protein
VDEQTLQSFLCNHHNLRIGNHTAKYLLAQLASPKKTRKIPLLANDARTGHPLHRHLTPADLTSPQPSLF